jgi:DNA-binding GntR family transcriptional regulator
MTFESKADVVARELRRQINTGEIAPGALLRQRQLAEEFGVSATPVREALQRLEALGYISTALHRGASVVRPDTERDSENSLIRATLEPLAAAWAAEKRTAKDLREIQGLHEAFMVATREGNDLAEANRRFHMRIYEVSGSHVLLEMIRHLWLGFRGGPNMQKAAEDSIPEHAALLVALKDQNAEAAALITKRHILGAMQYIPFNQKTLGYTPPPPFGDDLT